MNQSRAVFVALVLALPFTWAVACGDGDSSTAPSGASSSSSDAATSTSGTGGAGGGAGGNSSTATTSSGEGGIPNDWPSCESQPAGSEATTIQQIWQDNPAAPTSVWLEDVWITAISKGSCVAQEACDLFVQSQESFTDLATATHGSLRIFASPGTSQYFTGLSVGDKINVLANAWRYNINDENELLLQVNVALPGCSKKTGSGTPLPVSATLDDLTQDAFYNTLGPAFVTIDTLVGKPHLPDETFALWESGSSYDGGPEELISLSPYFLPGGVFVGLSPELLTNFTKVTGVFGIFVPDAQPVIRYKEVYPRTMSEVVFGGQ